MSALNTFLSSADTLRMSVKDVNSVAFEQNCLTVLDCYSVRDAAAKTAQAEYAGWLDRIIELPGLESSSLTSVHGFLIAQGLIRFEFTGRNVGLQYQLSPLGRDAIARRSLQLGEESRCFEHSADSAEEKSHAA
jgi:hypothetical protein